MELNLKKPIAFFDLETTGLNIASDRIIEISIVKISPGGKEEWFTSRVNPEMPVSPSATEVHGITDEDLKDEPTFKSLAHELAAFLEGCDLAGYNAIKFDIPVLAEEFLRVDVDFDLRKRKYIDVQVIFHKMEQRTLSAAYKFYCDKKLEDAHSARADTEASYEILKAQLDMYPNLSNEVDKLSEFSTYGKHADLAGRIVFDKNGREIFNFGKHKGRLVEEVLKEEPGYYAWMIRGDFPLYTKKILTEIRLRSFNQGQ
ncbi:MAG: 3'-5' exonuclease [Marinilabiliaceae bacterium]|jgi:DNA polymerase-3 subunit epsilon|nr:3'-5' exonuclease [Marinilabiliaceae bacterium]